MLVRRHAQWSQSRDRVLANDNLKYDPLLRKVRGDARYAALLRKMNLPAD